MISRLFLITTGLLLGLWLRGGIPPLADIGLPALALLALVLAVAAAPRTHAGDAKARLEDAFQQWLDARDAVRAAPHDTSAAAMMKSATNRLLVMANDRVIRSIRAASADSFSDAAVARVVIDMRRSLGRASVSLRPEQVETMLSAPAAQNADSPTAPLRPRSASLR